MSAFAILLESLKEDMSKPPGKFNLLALQAQSFID